MSYLNQLLYFSYLQLCLSDYPGHNKFLRANENQCGQYTNGNTSTYFLCFPRQIFLLLLFKVAFFIKGLCRAFRSSFPPSSIYFQFLQTASSIHPPGHFFSPLNASVLKSGLLEN